jgi:hypothetical protein
MVIGDVWHVVPRCNDDQVQNHNYEHYSMDALRPIGNCVKITTFVDENLMHDTVTWTSVTGIIQLLKMTSIEWFCKKQNTVSRDYYLWIGVCCSAHCN